MNSEFAFHPEARKELDEAVLWHEEQRPGLGEKLLRQVRMAMAHVATTPRGGTPVGRFRVWRVRRFPYAIVYLFEPSPLVIAFAHTRRRPGYWAERF